MKKVGLICASALTALSLGLFAGCDDGLISNGKFEKYDGSALYSVGSSVSGTMAAVQVREIDIEWAEGSVNVTVDASATEIAFTEDYEGKDACALRYRLAGDSLDLKYAAAGADVSQLGGKTLTLTLPASLILYELDITTQSANVTVRNVKGSEFQVETVSGNVDFVLGEISGFICEYETRSGSFNDGFGAQLRERDTYLYGVGGTEIDVETVSGNLTLRKA